MKVSNMINPTLDFSSRFKPFEVKSPKPKTPIKLHVVVKSYEKGSFWHKIEEDADEYDLCSIDIESDEECPVENPASEDSIFYHLAKDINLKFYKIYGQDESNDWKVEYLLEDIQNDPEDFRNYFEDLSPGDYTIGPRYYQFTDWEGNVEIELENVIIEKIILSFWQRIIKYIRSRTDWL